MDNLPSKTTLDEIEEFGISFFNDFKVINDYINKVYITASEFIIIDEKYDIDGNVTYTWHANMAIYSSDEKKVIARYWEFIKATRESINSFITDDKIYHLFNVKRKLDALIAFSLSSIITGKYSSEILNPSIQVDAPIAVTSDPTTDPETIPDPEIVSDANQII